MSLKARIAAIDRVQKSRGFKIGASIAVLVAAVAIIVWYFVAQTSGHELSIPVAVPSGSSEGTQVLDRLLQGSRDPSSVAAVIAALTGVAVVTIWLGLGLTYVALGIVAFAIAAPLLNFQSTEVYGRVILGVVILSASFTALLQGARLLLSGPGPIFAIARNVLSEAVRMRISLVFIVLLILGLATLPGVLDQSQALRYRVQSFLQYATGGTFWMLALLTLVFGVTTLTSEQRTHVIWQTVTKPVSAWQYLFGKWLGIVTLQGVLLAVCATGIFAFTSYLRSQPALGERAPYIAASGPDTVVEDRLILETQVLTATRRVEPVNPYSIDDPEFKKAVQQYIDNARISDPNFANTPAMRSKVESDLFKSLVQSYRSIDPQQEMSGEHYTFKGLQDARRRGLPITLRYRIDAAGNRPDMIYTLSFWIANSNNIITRRTGLGMNHTISLSPNYIAEDGTLEMIIYNGQIFDGPSGTGIVPNPSTFTFPPGGLQISYQASSYQMNFVRVITVLWLKLAFIAMLAIWASTFLSFSVASLVAIAIFLMAEMAGFLTKSLEIYRTADYEGHELMWRHVVAFISSVVARIFSVYADLDPVGRLVDGQLMSWSDVAYGTIVLAVVTLLLYAIGGAIFRKRELAIYSGNG